MGSDASSMVRRTGGASGGRWRVCLSRARKAQGVGRASNHITFLRELGHRHVFLRTQQAGICYSKPAGRFTVSRGMSALSEGKKILRPFDGVLEAAKQLLEIGVAIDEINVRSIDDQQIGSGVAEEEVFVGAHDRFKVFG